MKQKEIIYDGKLHTIFIITQAKAPGKSFPEGKRRSRAVQDGFWQRHGDVVVQDKYQEG